ncbi:MAG: hypothetical protein IPO08_20775 [Xanthomonadales bacterium]|nr:hypothetical protein [Xanthomonadales bacterium]
MKTFKTKSGTELPLLDLRGKDYLQVAHRLVWFREEHPTWTIKTDIAADFQNHRCLATAWIIDDKGTTLSMGHKVEDAKGFADYVEKAETGAIGRALAMVGYGTQFAPDLDEGDRLADSPVAPKHIFTQHVQPLNNAATNTVVKPTTAAISDNPGSYVPPSGKFTGKPLLSIPTQDLEGYLAWIRGLQNPNPKTMEIGMAIEAYLDFKGPKTTTVSHFPPTVAPKQQPAQPVLQSADTPPSWVTEGIDQSDAPF